MTDMSSESDLKARKEVETVMSGQLCSQAGKSLTLVVRLKTELHRGCKSYL